MFSLSGTQSTASALFSAYASLAGSMMLVRSMAADVLPGPVRSFIQSKIAHLFTPLSTQFTILIEEQTGMVHKQKNISLSIEKNQEIPDCYRDVLLNWRQVSVEPQNPGGYTQERRHFELSFNKKFKDVILDEYLPHVLARAKEIQERERVVKLYTRDCLYTDDHCYGGGGGGVWGCINLDHPATFDTLALDPELKRIVVEDLNRFVSRREYYKKVGKAWKRGYLLYGPPGTGKSSLIAAMANYLKFDIYDLELTSLYSNSELRRILVSTTNRSIVVIEDIDCSVEMHDREFGRQPSDTKLTLSGLLNFIEDNRFHNESQGQA